MIRFILPSLFFLHACASTPSQDSATQKGGLTRQAEKPALSKGAFDLDCPQDKLKLTTLSEDKFGGGISYGVSGCGRKVSYLCQRNLIGNAVCIKE